MAIENTRQPLPVMQAETHQKSIKEVLARPRESIIVPYSKEIEIGSNEGEYAHLSHDVEVQTFEDLQMLHLIPEKLDEKRTMEVLTTDDDAALAIARDSLHGQSKSCECQATGASGHSKMRMGYGVELRSVYQNIRKTQNQHLSRLLSEVYRREVAWDSIISAHVRGWIDRLQVTKRIPLKVFFVQDVTILNNATLHLSASTKLLSANHIRIHVGGKLITHSSYTKIKCESIQGNLA